MKQILIIFVALVGLGGCATTEPSLETITLGSNLLAGSAKAVENQLDRTDPHWLRNYCFSTLVEVAQAPVPYERIRGPLYTFVPIDSAERFVGANLLETCTLDYYIWPVAGEAFAEVGITHTWSEGTWNAFHEAVAASVSAQLIESGWRATYEQDELPTSFVRENRVESLIEYLDLYFTKDEEIIYELVVTDAR